MESADTIETEAAKGPTSISPIGDAIPLFPSPELQIRETSASVESDATIGTDIGNEFPNPLEHPSSLDALYTLTGADSWCRSTPQTLPGFAHLVPPAEQVLDSKDILPFILQILKESLGMKWKGPFASLILVNRSFFWAGTAILWREMASITPALKLLPWYGGGSQYEGLGKYHYTGRYQDWDRFRLYAPNIRHIKLGTEPGRPHESLEQLQVTELFFLPSRPPSLFPNIRTISIGQGGIPSLPAIQLLSSYSLQSLDIAAYPKNFPYEEDFYYEPCELEDVDQHVQAIIPFLHFYAPNIQSFHYIGPSENGIFERLSLLKNLTELHLEWVDPANACDLLSLRDLPLLQILHLATSKPVTPAPATVMTSPDGALYCPSLRTLKIRGNEMLQLILCMYQGVHQNLEELDLELTRIDRPSFVQRALGFYLGFNPRLESIRVWALPPHEQHPPWPAPTVIEMPAELSDLAIEVGARASFASCSNIRTATFEKIPPCLWSFTSSILQDSIGGWKRLTCLRFKAVDGSRHGPFGSNSRWALGTTFPGLTFLYTVIWRECPGLETLEFHFDQYRLRQEDLSLKGKIVNASARASRYPNGHPLRTLAINTTTYEDDDEEEEEDDRENLSLLGAERRIEVVAFLELLFPRLKELTGTPSNLWAVMVKWLETYRGLKAMAASGD